MKKFFAIIVLLGITSLVFSATEIKGIIPKGTKFAASYVKASYISLNFEFPRKHYDITGLLITNLNYLNDKTSISMQKFDLTNYPTIFVKGSLDIKSYNKKNGLYEFQLSFVPIMLNHKFTNPFIPIDGKVRFADDKYNCFIHGKFNYVDKKPYLTNLPKEGDCKINLGSLMDKDNESISLTSSENIPIILEIE